MSVADRLARLMRTVLFCADPGVPLYGPSGASAHLRGVGRALQALGWLEGMAVAHPHDARGRHDVTFRPPVVFGPWMRAPSGLRALTERVAAERLARRAERAFASPDRVWERGSLFCDAGLRWARRIGAEHVVELNAPLHLERNRPGRLRSLVRRTDRVLAVSEWMADWARRHGARDVTLLPNASDLRPSGALPSDHLTLVHHGSLQPWHGLSFLPALLDRLPEARLLLIGHGEAPRHPRVERTGYLEASALRGALESAHVGLLPYPDDAAPWYAPLKLADFAALGVPSVGSLHPATQGATFRIPLSDLQGWSCAIRTASARRLDPSGWNWSAAVQKATTG